MRNYHSMEIFIPESARQLQDYGQYFRYRRGALNLPANHCRPMAT